MFIMQSIMKYNKIQEGDQLLSLDTDFVKKSHKIDGFTFDNIKDFGIRAIPLKKELNDKKEAEFKNIGVDTVYFFQGDNKLNEFAYLLHKAISGEVRFYVNEKGVKVYRLEYSFSRKGKVSKRLHGYVTEDKLLYLCNALYSKRIAK